MLDRSLSIADMFREALTATIERKRSVEASADPSFKCRTWVAATEEKFSAVHVNLGCKVSIVTPAPPPRADSSC